MEQGLFSVVGRFRLNPDKIFVQIYTLYTILYLSINFVSKSNITLLLDALVQRNEEVKTF